MAAAVAAAQGAARDAASARERAAEKIDAAALPPAPADIPGLSGQLAGLEQLKAAGRWGRLATELDAVGRQAATAQQRFRDSEQQSAGLLQRRDELRRPAPGRYEAKAAHALVSRRGPGELIARHEHQARDLLWTAPCDLAAAAEAVARYQEAILALSRPGPRQVSP